MTEAVKIECRGCRGELVVEMPGGGHPEECAGCGEKLDPNELFQDAVAVMAEEERAEEERLRLAEVHDRRQQALPH